MIKTTTQLLRRSIAIGAVAALSACSSDATTLPASATRHVADVGSCSNVQVPADAKLAFHAYGTGVQIYRWTGSAWTFIAPSAVLSADAGGNSVVGTHYAGPTWESNSGSKVVGTVLERCPVPNTIPYLKLSAKAEGPGIFAQTTFIQRLNTTGGVAPTVPGLVVGQISEVPYTAEYFFYRGGN
ncbi:MAG: DUF3455 domain-containing protein [bacterium]